MAGVFTSGLENRGCFSGSVEVGKADGGPEGGRMISGFLASAAVMGWVVGGWGSVGSTEGGRAPRSWG